MSITVTVYLYLLPFTIYR